MLVEVPVTFGSRVGGLADLVVYKDAQKRDPIVAIEIATEVTKEEVDQVISYANAIDAEYAVLYDGDREIVLKKVDGEWKEHPDGFPPPEGGSKPVEGEAVEGETAEGPQNVADEVKELLGAGGEA